MSEDSKREHWMRLSISTNDKWKTADVAEQTFLILQEVQLDDGPFKDIRVLPDVSDDASLEDCANNAVVNIQAHIVALQNKAKREGVEHKLKEAITSIAYGLSIIKRIKFTKP